MRMLINILAFLLCASTVFGFSSFPTWQYVSTSGTLSNPASPPAETFYATYTVSQDGSGRDYSAATFNALTTIDTSGGDVAFYFDGTFTTRITVAAGLSGSSTGQVVLDGLEGGNCDPISGECSSSAILSAGMEIGNTSTSHPDYLTIQDFRMTRTGSVNSAFTINAPSGLPSKYVLIQRNYVHDVDSQIVQLYRVEYVVVKNNKFKNGTHVYDSSKLVNFIDVNYALISGNEIGHNDSELTSVGTSTELIEYHGVHKMLLEHNNLYGAPNQRAIEIKEDTAQEDLVIRYNKIHDSHSRTSGGEQAGGGVKVGGAEGGPAIANTYIYGNFIYGNWQWAIEAQADTTDYLYIWSNILASNGQSGITISSTRGNPEYIWIFNNTIASNADRNEVDLTRGGIVLAGGNFYNIGNNILWNNRPGGGGGYYFQFYNSRTLTTLDYNTYYHPSSSNLFYHDGGVRTLSTMQTTYSLEINGDARNPLFVDPDGADNTYGTDDDDYTLQAGSNEIGDGTDLSFSPAKTIDIGNSDAWMIAQLSGIAGVSSGVLTITGNEALNPNTDWSGQPSSQKILTLDRDVVGWDRGAYVYQ